MSWFDSLPTAEAAVPCGGGTHTVRWEAGRLALPAHPDAEAELVLGALGGDKPACISLAETWERHADDLAVLTAGPRCAADRVSVDWAEIAELRARLPDGPALGISAMRVSAAVRPFTRPGGSVPARPPGLVAGAPLRAGAMTGPGLGEVLRRQLLQVELLELLALGAQFQYRLAGTVTAAWARPERAGDRAVRRPELSGVLTGRFAPAAQAWLGIDPDVVTVTPHEGPGWGSLELTGTGRSRRLRAALAVSWLAEVWACGLAVVDGHLIVGVEEPGHPRARVLALATPDDQPVPRQAHATGGSSGGLAAWTL